MSGSVKTIGITITAADKASPSIERINKTIERLRGPADRASKVFKGFGETSGVNRMAEGVKVLGNHSLSFARSIERAAAPMASITSAASIAGVIELSRQWAKAGNSIRNVSYALSMPVDRVSALQGGAKLAGSSVEAMTKSLQGVNEAVKDAQFHRQDAATPYWQMLHIAPVGPDGKPITPDQMLRQFADATKNMTPHARMRAEGAFGIDPSLDPMLRNGSKGFDAYVAQAQKSGGVITQQMADDAKKMNSAWQRLGENIEGVGNRIVDSWSGTATKVARTTSRWIEHNTGLADSYAQIGIAVGALKSSAWLLKLLGFGTASTAVSTAGTLAMPLALGGDTPAGPAYQEAPGSEFFGANGPVARWWDRRAPSWAGGAPSGRSITAPKMPSAAYATMQQTRTFWKSKGFTDAQVAGILAGGPAAESGFNPGLSGDNGTSYGLYQDHNARMRALFARFGPHPTTAQQNEFAWDELNSPEDRPLLRALRNTSTPEQSALVWTSGFERPAGGAYEAQRRADAAGQFLPPTPPTGAVHVTVDLNGAHPGTTATATASGIATAAPPRIATSMPYAR